MKDIFEKAQCGYVQQMAGVGSFRLNFYNKFLAHTTKTINRDDYMKVALDKASRSNFVLKWLWDDEKKREDEIKEKNLKIEELQKLYDEAIEIRKRYSTDCEVGRPRLS